MKTTFCLLLAMGAARVMAADATYAGQIAQARAARVARLTTPDGWLTLIGLHFLQPGANTVGAAKDNAIVLAAGPAHVGTATLAADGKVTLALAPGAEALVDGAAVREAELRLGSGKTKPTLVTCGTVSFFLIERGGKRALRVKDSAAERRTHFLGLDYFPTDEAWRIEAQWVPFDKARLIPITNILGQTSPEPAPGKAVFTRDGKTYELLPIDEGPDEPLFFVFADATSGKETYGAGRFLYAERPTDGKIVLDFNRAQNPPCAFTPFATCPLPPKENRLPFAVTAGEKNYRGGHE
jgi:uncharacterized protein (DUF1684 family)